MPLSCDCDFNFDYDYGDWAYWYKDTPDFEPLKTSRRKRCCSCKELIGIGDLCTRYPRYRYPYSETEARIINADPDLDEEPPIKIADHYHCEECGEIWLNLTDIGYDCLSPSENMKDSLKEYHEMSGFKQEVVVE